MSRMEPLFQHLIVGLVPQPTRMPPAPFPADDLHRLFGEVTKDYPYRQFSFLPGDSGAEFGNSPEDSVSITPDLIQIRQPIAVSTPASLDKAVQITKCAVRRLGIENFLACGIKVIAHVALDGSAKEFVDRHLMGPEEGAKELGPNFFGGGIKYRGIEFGREDVLLIEPFIRDDHLLFIDYDVQRPQQFSGVDHLASWIDEAYDFVSGPTMKVLEAPA